jgi:hypothetical protein
VNDWHRRCFRWCEPRESTHGAQLDSRNGDGRADRRSPLRHANRPGLVAAVGGSDGGARGADGRGSHLILPKRGLIANWPRGGRDRGRTNGSWDCGLEHRPQEATSRMPTRGPHELRQKRYAS